MAFFSALASQLFRKYGNILQRCGLNWNIQGGDQQHVIVPKGATPRLAHVKDALLQLERRHGTRDGARLIPINVHEREIPAWTLSDERLKEYVLHVCPNVNKSDRSRTARRSSSRQPTCPLGPAARETS